MGARTSAARSITWATREDIDIGTDRLVRRELGCAVHDPVLAVEKRFARGALGWRHISYRHSRDGAVLQLPPRITQPVLMLNGRWDIDVSPEAQQRFLELLGNTGRPEEPRRSSRPATVHCRTTSSCARLSTGTTSTSARRAQSRSAGLSARPENSSTSCGRLEPASAVGQHQRVAPAGHAGAPTGWAWSRARRAHRRAAAPTTALRA